GVARSVVLMRHRAGLAVSARVATEKAQPGAMGTDSRIVVANDNRVEPYLTTEEARVYLRFQTTSGIRTAVMRGELVPAGAGPRGTHLFTREELDRWVRVRGSSRAGRQARPLGVEHEADALPWNHGTGTWTLRDPRAGDRPRDGEAKGGHAPRVVQPAR